jgi:hypothetical protein
MADDKTYPIEVLVINVALLERALDLLLSVFRKFIVTVDQLKVFLGSLPPVVQDIRRDTAPVAHVSNASPRRSRVARTTYQ